MGESAMSGRILHIVLVLVLAYVCVLNAVIVKVLYQRYLKVQTVSFVPMVRPAHNRSRPLLRERPQVDICEEVEGRVLVLMASEQLDSNDVFGRAPALPQLRHALRVRGSSREKVLLVVTSESFVGSHRSWCSGLNMQTQRRGTCELLLVKSPVTNADVMREVLQNSPCVEEMVLLPDTVQIKPSFFTRLSHTTTGRVTCLLAETGKMNQCPVQAFRVPRLFMQSYTGEAPVETAARGMHMYAGGAAVVSLS